jgi:hypothetical protein
MYDFSEYSPLALSRVLEAVTERMVELLDPAVRRGKYGWIGDHVQIQEGEFGWIIDIDPDIDSVCVKLEDSGEETWTEIDDVHNPEKDGR